MAEVSGDFEIHITTYDSKAEALAAFAERHEQKYVHILLDRGLHASQPMLTVTGSGTLDQQRSAVEHWHDELRRADIRPTRTKIEAAPWCAGVPRTDREAADEPAGRYFEHHIKLLLPRVTVTELVTIADLAEPHGARMSRNARRQRTDGSQERFVTQRCHGVGLDTAKHRLDGLVSDLRGAGHEILRIEQEYVVSDSDLRYDNGWLQPPASTEPAVRPKPPTRLVPAGSADYPPTYQPLPVGPALRQRPVFDPALKQYVNAYRAGEPAFLTASAGREWARARRDAMNHLLTVIAGTTWARHLVLRGSVAMAVWVGEAAREPGDLDLVVVPHTITSDRPEARTLLDDIVAALDANPGAGLRPDLAAESAIWTYERADGQRLVIPFSTADVPDGNVQVDIVFGERLPLPPEPLVLPGVDVPVLAAPPALALAWKLLWLATDLYPQGKDLYDAVLLAEYTTVDRDLVRRMLRPELDGEADRFAAESVLGWEIDWKNFVDEYPGVPGTAGPWLRRLALALDRAWS